MTANETRRRDLAFESFKVGSSAWHYRNLRSRPYISPQAATKELVGKGKAWSWTDLLMIRVLQCILIASTLLASWLGMQLVHEVGHALGALVTGGEVERMVLHPLDISRTDVKPNPRPLIVVWAGPIFGVLLPLVLWGAVSPIRLRGAFVFRFFAGFCLIANGAYIGFGSFSRIGDCGEMLRYGSSIWWLWLFGSLALLSGFWLWHRQGVYFGFGNSGSVDRRVAYASVLASLALVLLGLLLGEE